MEKTTGTVAEALRQAHAALTQDMNELEAMLASSPAAAPLHARLQTMRADLAKHFAFEEQNGYMAEVRRREPRLEHAIQQLAREHQELLQGLDTLLHDCVMSRTVDESLKARTLAWLRRLRKHELCENDLVQDAYQFDVSGED